MIYISSNKARHSVTKTFTPLHYACQHFTSSHLNFTQLHFTTLSFGLTSFNYRSVSPLITTLHLTVLLDDVRHTSIPFTSYEHFFPHNDRCHHLSKY